MFGVVTVVFFVLQLTGDPVRIMMGESSSEEDIQNVKHQLGLDRPIHEQYIAFLGKAIQGKRALPWIPFPTCCAGRRR